MKLTMKRVRVTMRAIHSKCRRIKGELNSKGDYKTLRDT